MDEGLQGGGAATTLRRRQPIQRQAPAGIKRHPEAMHRPVPEQRLKPHLGGDHVHRTGPLQQRSGMETIGADADAGVVEITAAEMTTGPTSDHIRVDLDQHRAVRVIPQRRLQHPPETGGPRQPQGD